MDNALTLEAPPTMFDDLEAILKRSECSLSLLSRDSITRGIRRKDTASYFVTLGSASAELWVERRVGNPTMVISIIPTRKSIWHPDLPSDTLAQRIVDWLVAHGANSE